MLGQRVTLRGIVTLIKQGQGFYLEESLSDDDPQTSNAIFIETEELPDEIQAGKSVSVYGMVTEAGNERDPLTSLSELQELAVCSSGHPLPLTDVSLPLGSAARESLEGMRIRINDKLVVSDVYRFDKGNFSVSGSGLLYVPTEVMKPGPATNDMLAENRASTLPVHVSENLGMTTPVASGTSVAEITGVLGHDDRGKRLTLQSLSGLSGLAIPAPAMATPDALRVVGMNLHNYFNGDGNGQGFPTPRGAETAKDFKQQRERIGAAIGELNPHVLAVMELENDGFGPSSAAQDFIQLANSSTQKNWAVTRPTDDNTGTDVITVGLFYRTDSLKAVGPAHTLTGPEFERSRQPQAQLFQRLPDGETVLIVINHLKSKGSCPESGLDANQQDGQGCWNDMRRRSALLMSAWAKQLAASMGTENILILGDMNAYRNEDPIDAIRQAGFSELVEQSELPTYSFAYGGQHGSLDYAFASEALLGQVHKAFIWHVNAPFPTRVELPQPWLGFSDHDPVIVELR